MRFPGLDPRGASSAAMSAALAGPPPSESAESADGSRPADDFEYVDQLIRQVVTNTDGNAQLSAMRAMIDVYDSSPDVNDLKEYLIQVLFIHRAAFKGVLEKLNAEEESKDFPLWLSAFLDIIEPFKRGLECAEPEVVTNFVCECSKFWMPERCDFVVLTEDIPNYFDDTLELLKTAKSVDDQELEPIDYVQQLVALSILFSKLPKNYPEGKLRLRAMLTEFVSENPDAVVRIREKLAEATESESKEVARRFFADIQMGEIMQVSFRKREENPFHGLFTVPNFSTAKAVPPHLEPLLGNPDFKGALERHFPGSMQ
ncbi:MAG: hypothetical protein P0S96_04645 [Simkaniaceae bacterium]|nr:hypothetical protein [Candidatus Sacchlamyda saccharinae]